MRVRLTGTDLPLLFAVVIWAASFSAVKYALREIGPLSFAAVRFLASAAFLLIWVWAVEGRPTIMKEDWIWVVLLGFTAIGVYQILFMVGLQHTTASNSSLLIATAPIWTAIIAAASRQERIAALQVVGILLSFAGAALVIYTGTGDPPLGWENSRGDLLTLIAAMLWASGAVIAKRPLRRYSSLRVLSTSMVCGSLFLLPFAWPSLVTEKWAQVSSGAWLALGYCTVFGVVIAFVIWYRSIGEIGAIRTMVYTTLTPPMAILIAIVTLGERITLLQALGAVVALGGVALTQFASGNGRKR